jgi:hypothetical protein
MAGINHQSHAPAQQVRRLPQYIQPCADKGDRKELRRLSHQRASAVVKAWHATILSSLRHWFSGDQCVCKGHSPRRWKGPRCCATSHMTTRLVGTARTHVVYTCVHAQCVYTHACTCTCTCTCTCMHTCMHARACVHVHFPLRSFFRACKNVFKKLFLVPNRGTIENLSPQLGTNCVCPLGARPSCYLMQNVQERTPARRGAPFPIQLTRWR